MFEITKHLFMNFFLGNFKPKGNLSPAKDVNHKTVRNFIPKWK
jgi:hypothetical protein